MPMRRCSLREPLFLDQVPSPIGTLLIVHDQEARLRALDFEDHEPRMRRLLRLHHGEDARNLVVKGGRGTKVIKHALAAYFAGDLTAVDRIAVATGGTAFQRDVWAALRQIAPGTTLSYGALAKKIGRPKAMRAVGVANGANPIAIVVPCHRVIGADTSLTGYGGGMDRKRWLLNHEGALFKGSTARRIPKRLRAKPTQSML
jgi:methylated-DNA-[protein]-cysteine S-methyltransferase